MQSDHFVNVGRIKVTYRRCKLSNSFACRNEHEFESTDLFYERHMA